MRSVIGLEELLAHLRGATGEPVLISGVGVDQWGEVEPAAIPAGSVVVGEQLGERVCREINRAGAAVFAVPPVDLDPAPFDPARASLYTSADLFDGFDAEDPCTYCDTTDARIYRHYLDHGGPDPEPAEALLRRVHDHQIGLHLKEWLDGRRVVAIMGGHDATRDSDSYWDVVKLGRDLSRRGYTVATGGGPGAMEAAHLGAYLANKAESLIDHARDSLVGAPDYRHREWLSSAFALRSRLDTEPGLAVDSVGIPTWTYGHEPPNAFATVYAKYFENSLREDGLVSIASHGIVFTRGNAGTVQEIFQDATQNHYGMIEARVSPMVFLGSQYWTVERPVLPLLRSLSDGKVYDKMIHAADTAEAIIDFIEAHPPQAVPANTWAYCTEFCDG